MATVIGRKTDTWSSRFGFIMAAVGSSVGLGNFWRFPYTAGENGGGAFILIYLLCVVLIGLPILMAEYAMGRKSGLSAIEGIQTLARNENKSPLWGVTGWIGSLAAFFILTFYMVISAWLVAYIPQAFSGAFSQFSDEAARQTAAALANSPDAKEVAAADISGARFEATIGNVPYILTLLAAFIGANVIIVARGIRSGLERAASILMPLFFIMLIGIVIVAALTGDFGKAAAFLFKPKWEDVTFATFLAALGQAFFSIGVGVGLMLTYGAYLQKDTDIPRSSMIVAGSDTLVAIVAGLAIFPIVFGFGGNVAGGPGLFFVSLPIAFGQMPGGDILAGIFFTLALFAALTSSISLMEVSISWLEERHGVTRWGASIGIGFALFVIGSAYVYSSEYLDFVDYVTGSLMLPLGGLLIAVFAGWALSQGSLTAELGTGMLMQVWRFLIRWFVPPFVAVILVLGSLGKAEQNCWLDLPGWMPLNPDKALAQCASD